MQFGGGFHHDHDGVGGPGNGESKTVCLDAKIGLEIQNRRIGQQPGGYGKPGSRGKGWPAGGARQGENGRNRSIHEGGRIHCGRGVSLEKYRLKTGAITKSIEANAADSSRDDDIGKAGVIKGIIANTGNGGGKHHAFQGRAILKYGNPDASDAVGNSDGGQFGAIIKCVVADVRDTGGDGEASQTVTVVECGAADAGDIGSQRNVGQADAIEKYRIPNGGNSIADREASQPGTICKDKAAEITKAVAEGDGRRQAGAIVKCAVTKVGEAGRNGGSGQRAAVIKGVVADARDATGNDDTGQVGAVNWDHDKEGEAEFWPSGDNEGAQLVFGSSSNVTSTELLALDRLLEELGGDTEENFLKIHFAVNNRGYDLCNLTAEAVQDEPLHIFSGACFTDVRKDAAYELFELFYPEAYQAWKSSTCDGLIFDEDRFIDSPGFSVDEVRFGGKAVLLVLPQ